METDRFSAGRTLWVGLALALQPWQAAVAGLSLEFEWPEYPVAAGGESAIDLRVMLDGDTGADGRQPVPNGLFSYGFVVRFDGDRLRAISGEAVRVDPALDYFGFGNGARVTEGDGFVAVKGNIHPTGDFWTGTELGTVRLQITGPIAGPVALTLEVFEESAGEAVFVDGSGSEIDAAIETRASAVTTLAPLRIERVDGGGPVVRLTFGVHPSADVTVEWSRSLTPGEWQPLPGAPHNSGEVLDSANDGRRFYRLKSRSR